MLRNREVVPYSQGSNVNGPEVHSLVPFREHSERVFLVWWWWPPWRAAWCVIFVNCGLMLCYVIICLEDLDLPCGGHDCLKCHQVHARLPQSKKCGHHCNIRYSWQWARDDVARQAPKGYGLIGMAMKKIAVARIEASSQVQLCIDK